MKEPLIMEESKSLNYKISEKVENSLNSQPLFNMVMVCSQTMPELQNSLFHMNVYFISK